MLAKSVTRLSGVGMSIIIYSSEADAMEENAQRQEMRKKTISDTGHKMVEETMGEVLSIMSEV